MNKNKDELLKKYTIIFIFISVVFISTGIVEAYGECEQYGVMAMYESWSGTCKCMLGYSFGKNFMGQTYCISDDQLCKDEYGYNARSDYSGSCKCGYGYVFGKDSLGRTQCISDDEACRDQLGLHSRATYSGDCECSYGYVIDNGKCTYGDTVCRNDHGIYSSYDSISNRCECDDDYTFNDGMQCVEKQHNAYFTVLDVNIDTSEAIIQSEYDYSTYLIEYGFGCYDYTIEKYVGSNLVVNLGTDYDVDWYDTIVLQNHNQTCDVTDVSYTSFNSFDEIYPEEGENYYYPTNSYSPTLSPVSVDTYLDKTGVAEDVINEETPDVQSNKEVSTTTVSDYEEKPEIIKKDSLWRKVKNWFKNLF